MPETKNETCIYFQTRDELVKVDLNKVIFFESDGNYIKAHFVNGCVATVLLTLGNLEKIIDERMAGKVKPYIRIGRRFVINTSYIFHINTLRQQLVLTDCMTPTVYTLSVSKEALKTIKNLYIEKSLWK